MSDDSFQDALFRAIQGGDLAAVAALLDRGADINASARLKLSEPGHLNTLTWKLLEMNAAKGITPLRLAAWYGHTALAHLLLERGADINAGERFAWPPTAVVIAAEHEYDELTRLLLDRGADVNTGMGQDKRPSGHGGAAHACRSTGVIR
jgi:ankyrin repeat protein